MLAQQARVNSSVAPSRHGEHDTGREKQLFVCNLARIRGDGSATRHGDAAHYEQGTGQGTEAVCATVRGKERTARARQGSGGGARPMGGARRRWGPALRVQAYQGAAARINLINAQQAGTTRDSVHGAHDTRKGKASALRESLY